MSSLRTSARRLAATLSVCSLVSLVAAVPSWSLAAEPPAPTLIMKKAAPDAPRPAADEMAAEPAAQPRAGLRVNAEALGASEGPTIAAKIEEVALAIYADRGFAEPLDGLDPVIVVEIIRAADPENPGFVIGFSVEQGEDDEKEILEGSARQADCSLCTRTELVERVEREISPLLKIAAANQVERAVADEGGAEGADGDVGSDEGDDGSREVAPIGPLGFAGIAVGVLGLGGVGAGAGLAAKGFEVIEERPIERRNFRTPGVATLAVGGVALVAGVVMIAIDVSKRKKQRDSQSARVRWRGLGVSF